MEYPIRSFHIDLLYSAPDIAGKSDFFSCPVIGGTLGVSHACMNESTLVIIPPQEGISFLEFGSQGRATVTKEENK